MEQWVGMVKGLYPKIIRQNSLRITKYHLEALISEAL
jgi:hypothetical protein